MNWRKSKVEVTEQLQLKTVVLAPNSNMFNSINFWFEQFNSAADEILSELSGATPVDALKRKAETCGAWADAALDVAEKRWRMKTEEAK